MDFNDDHSEDVQTPNNKQRKWGFFVSGFIGAVLGGLLIAYLIFRTDIFLDKFNQVSISEGNLIPAEKNLAQNIQRISVEVETDITKAVDKASNSVVGISNFQAGSFWDEAEEVSTGSGVIYKKSNGYAYVVTNQHVIEDADSLEIILSNGKRIPAISLGGDVWTDLAVLRMDAAEIESVAEFGNSDALKLGEPVIAIGNPLGIEFAGSITQGVVSGLERTVPVDVNQDGTVDWNAEVLQTDAAINPGNSGGALVNIAGQVVGINSMKVAQQEVEGIGFSIPVNSAIPIISDLENYGVVKRPYMGVYLRDLNRISTVHIEKSLDLPKDIQSGVLLADIEPNGPADKAGLQDKDVIVKLDEQPIETILDLRKYLYKEKEIGESLKVGYYRRGEYQEATMILSEGNL